MRSGRVLMVQGAGSSVGKALLVALLCRLFRRAGLAVAPFEAQSTTGETARAARGVEFAVARAVRAAATGPSPADSGTPVTRAARPSAGGESNLRSGAAVPAAGVPSSRAAGMPSSGTAGVRPLLDGLWLECGAGRVVLRSEAPLATVSSAVLGGGLGPAHTILALRVPPDYTSLTPAADLSAAAAELGLLPPVVGLLTAAPVDRPGVAVRRARGLSAAAVVTAGLANACTAGSGAPAAWRPGTINAVVVLDARLAPGALVNAVVAVTEAKAALLARRGVRGPTGEPATGTTTDAVVVAATGRGPLLPFGGPGTLAGWLAARALRAALAAALDARAGGARQGIRGARPGIPGIRG